MGRDEREMRVEEKRRQRRDGERWARTAFLCLTGCNSSPLRAERERERLKEIDRQMQRDVPVGKGFENDFPARDSNVSWDPKENN